MTIHTLARVAIAAALGSGLLAAPLAAQTGDPTAEDPQALMLELQQLQQRLAAVEAQVLQENEMLRDGMESTRKAVVTAMIEIRPETEADLSRLETLGAEMQQAGQSGDAEKTQALRAAAAEIQERLGRTQAEAVEREDVARQIQEFRDGLLGEMRQIEPKTDSMFARMEEIAERLR